MKINDLVVLKKDKVNAYRNWDKGEVVRVVGFKNVTGELWVRVQDQYGDNLSLSVNDVELKEGTK